MTQSNVGNIKDYVEQISDFSDDLQTACEESGQSRKLKARIEQLEALQKETRS